MGWGMLASGMILPGRVEAVEQLCPICFSKHSFPHLEGIALLEELLAAEIATLLELHALLVEVVGGMLLGTGDLAVIQALLRLLGLLGRPLLLSLPLLPRLENPAAALHPFPPLLIAGDGPHLLPLTFVRLLLRGGPDCLPRWFLLFLRVGWRSGGRGGGSMFFQFLEDHGDDGGLVLGIEGVGVEEGADEGREVGLPGHLDFVALGANAEADLKLQLLVAHPIIIRSAGGGWVVLKYIMYLSFSQKWLSITREGEMSASLEISYEGLRMAEVKASLNSHALRFEALLGLKIIDKTPLLLIAALARTVTTIGLSPICEIQRVAWVAVAPEDQQERLLREAAEELGAIEQLFGDGLHYYSQLYDLSLPYLFNKVRAPDPPTRHYYDQFVWNANLASMDGWEDRATAKLFGKYCSRVVQGYLQQFASFLPSNQKIRYILVSRRSARKAGTRFYARGIDDEGSVANFVETEQIAEVSELVFTHLQVRGSVPAFFAQTGVNGIAGELVVERSAGLSMGAFVKHFSQLRAIYERILAVNLLSEKKGEERLLSNFYEELVFESTETPFLRYQFYDFHEECRNNRFENSEALVQQLAAVSDCFGFTCYDATQEVLLRQQGGVMRTNCLDCLDRTNYVQSRLALHAFRSFLLRFAGHETEELISQKKLLDLPVNESYPLLRGFNSLWADNGDSISLLYTGIQSTHTDITRTGERTLMGSVNHKFRSLMRFYTQFTDHRKQQAINTLLLPSSPLRDSSPLHDFHTTLALSFPQNEDEEALTEEVQRLLLKERPTLIVYFVFSKEQAGWLDKLRCYFKSEGPEIKAWVSILEESSREQGYVMVGDLESEGCWLGVFCRREALQRVSQIKKESLSKSLSAGEALLIKMRLESSSFIFAGVNCSSLPEFLTVFDELHEKGFQTSKLGQFRSASLFDLDYRVVLGNTGAKLRLPPGQAERLRGELQSARGEGEGGRLARVLGRVLDADELNLQQLRYRNKFIRHYSEGPVEFFPSGNRLLFWNEEGVVLRVREYGCAGQGGLRAVLDYEVGRGRRE